MISPDTFFSTGFSHLPFFLPVWQPQDALLFSFSLFDFSFISSLLVKGCLLNSYHTGKTHKSHGHHTGNDHGDRHGLKWEGDIAILHFLS